MDKFLNTIEIDEITDCLVERASGKLCSTEYRLRGTAISTSEYAGWNFDWSRTEKNGFQIFELFVFGDEDVQGRISVKMQGNYAEAEIAENAPWNIGHNGKYIGVGAHLFAIACKYSMDNGGDGFLAFYAKTALIDHYRKTLNAVHDGGQRMHIDEQGAQFLIKKYLLK